MMISGTTITTDSRSQCGRQRLAILIIVSVTIHGGMLFLSVPGFDTQSELDSTMAQTIQINLIPHRHASPLGHTKKAPEKMLHAWQLIERSQDHIRSQDMEETGRLPYQTFGNTVPDSDLDTLVTTVKAQVVPIETYRSFSGGNLRVKMISMFGGFQCFEILPPDPLDAFSAGVWLLVRC